MWKHSDSVKTRAAREVRQASVEAARASARKFKAKWWTWQASPANATAHLFVIGALCLLFGSSMRIFKDISQNADLLRLYVLTPYFIGGVCFTFGCAVPLPRTSAQLKLSDLQVKKRQRHRSEREVERIRTQKKWALVDHVGAVVAVTGGLFINAATYIEVKQASKAGLRYTTKENELWSITAPVMFGRALFMISGWFTWAARNKSWSLSLRSGTVHFWWTTVLFWFGASGFYLGWFWTSSPFQVLPELLVESWSGVLTGYICGSLLLLSASYIMLLELAHKETQSNEMPELDAALIKV